MMKKGYFLLSLLVSNMAFATSMNEAFNQGRDVGKGNNSNAQQIMKDFQPNQIQGYQARPQESQYYTGVKGGNPNLMGTGMSKLENSESGKAIKDSIINNPKVDISQESDFIKSSNNIRDNAEVISGIKGGKCVNKVLSKTSFSSHFCEKDNSVEYQCSKTANVKWLGDVKIKKISFNFPNLGDDYKRIKDEQAQIIAPEDGTIIGFSMNNKQCVSDSKKYRLVYCDMRNISFLGVSVGDLDYSKTEVNISNISVKTRKGEKLYINRHVTKKFLGSTPWGWHMVANKSYATLNITLHYLKEENSLKPKIEWDSNCPVNTGNAIEINSQCTQPAETREFEREGNKFKLYQDCWQYKYHYLINESSDNECKKYENNSNCTVGERECILNDNGSCIRHRLKYQCQTTKKTDGYICGDKFFCSDGSCSDLEGSVNSDFGHAVSQLATLAQAGKDVGLDPDHLKAFSGKAMFCRKSGFGFSDCCKDSGWGHKAGLAKCNSEENALGKAKEKKLVVYVGTFCSKKVLKTCVQRKSGYCVFDNKLARIIQYQGRSGQLGIGFGGAKNPDCRGITVDELQRIDFNAMDYSDFYDELNERTNLPDKQQLMEHMRNSIINQLQEK